MSKRFSILLIVLVIVSSIGGPEIALSQDIKVLQAERSEAQRFYDLGLSYFMSGMYREGLDTINKVAFLYPDSDIADDAIYQLALIRERAGNGEIIIGDEIANALSIETIKRIRAYSRYSNDSWERLFYSLNELIDLSHKRESVIETAKIKAINQYLVALDYLNILIQRYPMSEKLKEVEITQERILSKIDSLTKKEIETYKKTYKITKRTRMIVLGSIASVALLLLVLFPLIE